MSARRAASGPGPGLAWRLAPLALALTLALHGCHTADLADPAADLAGPGGPGPAWIQAEQNVYIQEYWQGGVPYYLIANLRPVDATIVVTGPVAHAGPWTLKAQTLLRVPVAALAQAPSEGPGKDGATYRFSLDDGTALGSLRAPRPPAAAIGGPLAYVQGLDGLGAGLAWAGIAATASGLPTAPGGRGRLTLHVVKGAGDLRFAPGAAAEAPQLPEARVVDVTSATLPVRRQAGVITVANPGPAAGGTDLGQLATVELTFEVAAGATGPLAELHGEVATASGRGVLSYGVPMVR